MKTSRRIVGDAVELAAEQLLRRAGLVCLARQYATRQGEVDLILRDGDVLVFVEVRFRRHDDFGGAFASVDRHKQSRVVKAALAYVGAHPGLSRMPIRFDVVAGSGSPDAPKLDWTKDAFRG